MLTNDTKALLAELRECRLLLAENRKALKMLVRQGQKNKSPGCPPPESSQG